MKRLILAINPLRKYIRNKMTDRPNNNGIKGELNNSTPINYPLVKTDGVFSKDLAWDTTKNHSKFFFFAVQ